MNLKSNTKRTLLIVRRYQFEWVCNDNIHLFQIQKQEWERSFQLWFWKKNTQKKKWKFLIRIWKQKMFSRSDRFWSEKNERTNERIQIDLIEFNWREIIITFKVRKNHFRGKRSEKVREEGKSKKGLKLLMNQRYW